jgi:protein TonB
VITGVLSGLNNAGPPPPISAPSKPKSPRRIKVSVLESARLIHSPRPDYPPLAKMAHVQGTVRLEAIIGTDGRIQNLKVIGGHPLLVNATLQAVVQWRYQPTLLNGEPVEVQTEIDVNFRLGE